MLPLLCRELTRPIFKPFFKKVSKMNIEKFSRLIEISIHCGTLRTNKQSKAVKQDAADASKITSDNVSGGVRLWSSVDSATKIASAITAVRNQIAAISVFVFGSRYLIEPSRFAEAKTILDAAVTSIGKQFDEFATGLTGFVEQERQAKGPLFNRDHYETESEIRAKKLTWTFRPQSDVSTFAKIFDDAAIEAEIRQEFEVQQSRLQRQIDNQLYERIESILVEPAKTVNGKTIRTSAIERLRHAAIQGKGLRPETVKNAMETARELTTRNVTGCQRLANLRSSIADWQSDFAGLCQDDSTNAANAIARMFGLPTTATAAVPEATATAAAPELVTADMLF